ncbi:hypothetical protein B0T25DRAFT_534295 [Lasiosphaeria hispida]|uniref:Uncharacterized protein n=1 Tax=Lasiosphaeria hispida TaxID=260671 RepID=A0AAJ0HRF6_9PEZI|nr:hypothetical protein B0T25DRAFT_534295 [Lasiosphaeria hispida]
MHLFGPFVTCLPHLSKSLSDRTTSTNLRSVLMEQNRTKQRGGERRRPPRQRQKRPTEGLPWVTVLRSPVIPAFLSWIITAMSMVVLSRLRGEGLQKLVHGLPRFDPTSTSQLSAFVRHIVSYGVPILLLSLLVLLEIVYWINTIDLFWRGRWRNLHLLWVAPATVIGTCLSAFAVQDLAALILVAVPVLLDILIAVCLVSDTLSLLSSA